MPRKNDLFQSTLQTAGHRLTGQRQLLLDLIGEHGGHLDATELFRLARARSPRLSLATVYRTVALLRDLGLVDEVHLGEEHHHYELKPNQEHAHIVCTRCGRVVEFTSPLVAHLRTAIAGEYGFEVTGAQIDLSGLCEQCRRDP